MLLTKCDEGQDEEDGQSDSFYVHFVRSFMQIKFVSSSTQSCWVGV